MIHIGQCIRRQVEEQGKTSVWLARELGCHRTNLYKIYDKRTLDTGILLRISRILHYDFFRLYSDSL
ncbi:MAG: XRE family transcriptional regulator [Prevotella sp.]|nr:XRE family transcriptional regulator [Prevotella sp.]